MPFHRDGSARKLRENALESLGILREGGSRVFADVALIVIEEGVLHFALQPLLQCFFGRSRWRRWRRRNRNVDRHAPGDAASWPCGDQFIACRLIRINRMTAAGLNRTDARTEGHLCRIASGPFQSGRLPTFDGRRLCREFIDRRSRGWLRRLLHNRRWGRRWRRWRLLFAAR